MRRPVGKVLEPVVTVGETELPRTAKKAAEGSRDRRGSTRIRRLREVEAVGPVNGIGHSWPVYALLGGRRGAVALGAVISTEPLR